MARPRKVRPFLTKRAIDESRPGTRVEFLWDGMVHGLGLKITPAGSKIFILDKTVRGRLKRFTLGHFGDVTLDQARRQAQQLVGQIAEGRDPGAEKKFALAEEKRQARETRTVRDLWGRYLADVVTLDNKPSTANEKRRLWQRRIEPMIGGLRINDVTESDLSTVIRSPLRFDDEGRVVKGRAEAGNLYRLLHHLFRKAISWKIRNRELGDPLESIPEPKVGRRERLLSASEVGALLREVDRSSKTGGEPPHVLAVIKLAVLTGARISELLSLQWKYVRRAEMELHFDDTKSGFSRRPLSSEALSVIDGLDHVEGFPFVFAASSNPTQKLSYNTAEKVFQRIVTRAGISKCTFHTIRHWFATMTANAVSNPRIGMALTGHKSYAAYINYVHGDKEQAQVLVNQMAVLAKGTMSQPDEEMSVAKQETSAKQGDQGIAGAPDPRKN
jgi:integrase